MEVKERRLEFAFFVLNAKFSPVVTDKYEKWTLKGFELLTHSAKPAVWALHGNKTQWIGCNQGNGASLRHSILVSISFFRDKLLVRCWNQLEWSKCFASFNMEIHLKIE